MAISLEYILELLQDRFADNQSGPAVAARRGEGAKLENVALLQEKPQELDEHILWCGPEQSFRKLPPGQVDGRCFLLWSDRSVTQPLIDSENAANCLYLPADVDPAEAINLIQREFFKLYRWEQALNIAMLEGKELQALVDISAPIMKHPLVMWNTAYELVAATTGMKSDREPLAELLKNGYLSGQTVAHLIAKGWVNETKRFATMEIHYPPNMMNCSFSLRVFTNEGKFNVTMVQYYLDSPPTLGQLELLELFQQHAEAYISQYVSNQIVRTHAVYDSLFIDLLAGRVTTEEKVRDRLAYVRMPFESYYVLMEVKIPHYTSPIVEYVIRACKTVFPFQKAVEHEKSVFFLLDFSRYTEESAREEKLAALAHVLQSVDAVCGMSRPFKTLLGIHAAALETRAALSMYKLGEVKSRIIEYEKVIFQHMFRAYGDSQSISLVQVLSEPVKQLYINDRLAGNDNMELLDFYLSNNGNITLTAKKISLHRNSVIYRLGRINDLFENGLSDPETRFQIMTMLRILDLPSVRAELDELVKQMKGDKAIAQTEE